LEVPSEGTVQFKNKANEVVATLKMQISTSLSSLFHVDKGLVKQLPFGTMQCKTFTTKNDPKKLTSYSQAWMSYMNDVIDIRFITQANVYHSESVKNALHVWFMRKSPNNSTPKITPFNSPINDLPVGGKV
jgi:hypothetical protein